MPGGPKWTKEYKGTKETSELLGQAPAKAPATGLQLSVNIITCGLGTGIFTLPWSTAGASVLPAIAIIAIVLALNSWTISILVEAAERHQVFDLGGLLACLPGRLGRAAQVGCNVTLWISMYLCLVGYIIVIVDCIRMAVPWIAADHRSLVVMLTSFAVLPLCFLDQRRLSVVSGVAVIANINILALVVALFGYKAVEGSVPQTCYFGISTGCIAMVSAMMQSVIIQMCVLPMFAEMQDRNAGKFNRIIAASFFVLFLFCSGIAVCGYLTFGQQVHSNVLLDLPMTYWGTVARLCAAAAVIGVFPIIMGPMIAPLRAALDDYGTDSKLTITTCFIVFAVMTAALDVDNLGRINVVNGALSLGTFVAIVPSLVGLHLLGPKSAQPSWRAAMYLLAVFGLTFSALGLIFTDNYFVDLKASCSWEKGAAPQQLA